jgi:hypothetical protein
MSVAVTETMKNFSIAVLILSAAVLAFPPILRSKAEYDIQGTDATVPIDAQILTSRPK